jgi:ABC-type branched-subunit amino acid transport system ATPase component/branched-subunit amino acid ABC-type transport system permease component
MKEFLQLAVIGLATGALYVPFGLGLVITQRGSGVVNFAQGAVGMIGAYVYWWLDERTSVTVAFVGGILVSALLGLATYFVAIRPLRATPMLTKVIATLAVLTILEQVAVQIFPSGTTVLKSNLPTNSVTILGTPVGVNLLYILLISVLLTAALGALYRYTKFGQATVASAENRRAVAALGFSPDLLAAGNWTLSGVLAAVAGILLAPITGLNVTLYTLLIVPALAAAVVGRLISFPLTLAGGLAVGLIQSETSLYLPSGGWAAASPFFVTILVLVFRGGDRTLRTSLGQRLPRLGSGRLRLRVVAPVLAVMIAVIMILPLDWNDAVTTTVGTGLILLSLVIVTGYTGQLSLAQFAFAGWGAWIAGLVAADWNLPFPLAVLAGALAGLPLGLLLGAVCLRMSGIGLAIATLGVAVALDDIVFSNVPFGQYGQITVPTPTVAGLNVSAILYSNRYAIVVVVCFTICAVAVSNLRRSRSGRRMIAVRANERAAASIGIGVTGAKLAAFGIASFVASLGGALLAFRNPVIVFDDYSPLASVDLVTDGVVGGIGWIAGTLYGALLQGGSLVGQALDEFTGLSSWLPLVAGALVLVVLVSAPDGLAFQDWRRIGKLRARLHVPRKPDPLPELPAPTAAKRVRGRRLKVEDLVVRFGGVTALDGVHLEVQPGQVVGLIGPNGAGKTTLVDVVTGYVKPAEGSVDLDETRVSDYRASKVAQQGIARSFQSVEVFDDMTVLDNIRVASENHSTWRYVTDLFWPAVPRLAAPAAAAIREFGLEPDLGRVSAELPYGRRRLVGIARAVATEASVLLLDEPAAGLDDHEKDELGILIRRLADEWGMGILLIEHDVEMAMRLCERIYVLNFGKVIAVGPPAEIRNDPEVVTAYLGKSLDPPSLEPTSSTSAQES